MSPWPGRSILITSAPNQARSWVQVGPDCTCVKSRILMPSSALPSLPHGFLEGAFDDSLGFLATSFSAGRLAGFALALTLFLPLAAAFALAFFAIFFAIILPLFLLQLALR